MRKLMQICELLHGEVPHYDWVGFYLVDPDAERRLVLGPYVGAPTEHTRILREGDLRSGSGHRDDLHHPGRRPGDELPLDDPDVRAEIVVPVMRENIVLGELDIDSRALAPFSREDHLFLKSRLRRSRPLL